MGILQGSPDGSSVQPGLRVNGLDINFTKFLVSIPPWTWHCTERERGDKLWERSGEVSFSRGTAGAWVCQPNGISRMNTREDGAEELEVGFFTSIPSVCYFPAMDIDWDIYS